MRQPEALVPPAVVELGRALREAGVGAGIDDELTLLRALGELDVREREQVYWAARATFVRRRGEERLFDPVFARFWAGLPLIAAGTGGAEHGESDPRMAGSAHGGESLPQYRSEGRSGHLLDGNSVRATSPLEVATSSGDQPGEGHRRGVLAAYSPEEALTDAERLGYERDEILAVRRLADELRAAAPERLSRRPRRSRRPGRLDVRRTVRGSLRTDGELIRPAFVSTSRRPRRIVFLCDVSGSMERYSRALLASLGAAVGAGIKAEAFVFATRLTRLTGDLRRHDLGRALEEARAAVADWSGGTRIGPALAEFRGTYGARGLARGAVVVVVSDGWDRGDPDQLAAELDRLRRECRRLVWLNPRPAGLDGQPLATGMRAALPYLDDYVAGHDPRAVAALTRLIAGVGRGRPVRPQRPVRS